MGKLSFKATLIGKTTQHHHRPQSDRKRQQHRDYQLRLCCTLLDGQFQKSHGDANAGTGAGTVSRNLTDLLRSDATFASTSSGVSAVPASWNTQSMSSL
jgi:hypothetical protein